MESHQGGDWGSPPFDFLDAKHSHWAIDVSIDHFGFPRYLDGLQTKYSKLLDHFYDRALSTSTEFTCLLAYLPGFLTWKSPIPIEWLEGIYGVSNEILLPSLEKNAPFIRRWQSYYGSHSSEVLSMNAHLSNFLLDRWRAQFHYQDPEQQGMTACRHLITIAFHGDWVKAIR